MSCPRPHPLRGPDGLSFAEDLEVVGSCNADAWVRCQRCGCWFWMATDTGGKYEYVGEVELETSLAVRAFRGHDLRAALRLLARHGLPIGPVWESEHARLELLRQLSPGATDAERLRALEETDLGESDWPSVAALLRSRAGAAAAVGPVPPFPFVLDGAVDGRGLEGPAELPEAIVFHRTLPPFEIVRLDAHGAVTRAPLQGRPRWLATTEARAIWGVESPEGERVLTLGAAGDMFSWSATPWRYDVQPLEDGWWQFLRESTEEVRLLELRQPDTTRVGTLRMRAAAFGSVPAPMRRHGDGWVVSGVLTEEDEELALGLLDGELRLVARSAEAGENRILAPVGDGSIWAETTKPPYLLERWVVEGARLRRTHAQAVAGWAAVGDGIVAFPRAGGLVGLTFSGEERWKRPQAEWGYFTVQGARVLVTRGSGAEIFQAEDGATVEKLTMHAQPPGPDVLVDRTGTVYVAGDEWLWTISGEGVVRRVALPARMELCTTCGDAALFGNPEEGRFAVVGGDGAIRGGFEARGANFSVVGTRAGPYVLEAARLRVGSFCIRS